MRKRTTSLRGRMSALMAAIAILECVVLLVTLSVSGVYRELDATAYRYFRSDSEDRIALIDNGIGQLIQNATVTAEAISAKGQQIAEANGTALDRAYTDDELYDEIAVQCAANVIDFLHGNAVSGAFLILDGSNASPEDAEAHSAVFIHNAAPGVTDDRDGNLRLEVGPVDVAREYRIATGDRWALDMYVSESAGYYTNPIQACEEYPRSELVRYGYWSPPTALLPTTRQSVSYTLPLLDGQGVPWGVVGFEMSLSLFTSTYLSNIAPPYPESFYAITSAEGDEIDTDWVIPGSPAASAHLAPSEPVTVAEVPDAGLYEARLDGLGEMYCTVTPLTMYSRNSPFADENWMLVGMVERDVLNAMSKSTARAMLTNMAIMLVAAFVAIFVLSYLSCRKIESLSEYIDALGPGSDIRFEPTHLREIDNLTSAIERLNRRVNDSLKVTSKMMELSQLPLGGFEVSNDMDTVMLTEYIYTLLHMEDGEAVSRAEWRRIYNELTAHPADGYANVYRYDGQSALGLRMDGPGDGKALPAADGAGAEDLYQYGKSMDAQQKWLRIIEAQIENGSVGMILDCTSDIDQLMRLTHELDYDALTHLYNRTAFKRESFKKITLDPDRVGAMIFSDLDNLKHTNDTFGHRMGDQLIMKAASLFRRFMDYGGIVARISGDEFAIFLHGFESKREVMDIIRKVLGEFPRQHIRTPDGSKVWLSCSSGIAWYPRDSTDVSDLLKLSDYAMYEAKRSRKGSLYERDGQLVEFDENAEDEAERRRRRREDLSILVHEERFQFKFQPILDLRSCDLFGYEALMAPHTGSLRTPREVLAAARAESMLDQLEGVIVRKALAEVEKNKERMGKRKVFVNSIPGRTLEDETWHELEQAYGSILPDIVFEVTESENDDLEKMTDKLGKLRELGISIAIDGFGRGYSNEARIVAMQPSYIKIDLELLRNLQSDSGKLNTVRHLVAFAHAHGIGVVAMGIEQVRQLETAVKLGMDYAQGYLLGRPEYDIRQLSKHVRKLLEDARGEQG